MVLQSKISQAVVDALSSVLSTNGRFIPLHEPAFVGNEWEYVKECIDTGWVSSTGKYVDRFELMLAEFTGVKRAVATSNGTSALHIALELAGVERDDEVLVPALSFVATANAVAYCGAIPHFVDIERSTLGIDPERLDAYLGEIGQKSERGLINKKTGRCIRSIVPVHIFGHPCKIDALLEVANRYGLVLVEDAAESLGSYVNGRHTGAHGFLSAVSFNGNKTITTGGGGAVLSNDSALADRCKHITTTAKVPHQWRYFHDVTGYNYRMPNINAALGCAQLEALPRYLELKRELARRYREAFAKVEGVAFHDEPQGCQSNFWLNALVLEKADKELLDQLLEKTNKANIMTRPAWDVLAELPMYQGAPADELTVAKEMTERLINIPSSPCILFDQKE